MTHLARIGRAPRPAGGQAAADARGYCAGVLAGLGFSVKEHSFVYSKFTGAWAAPAAGVLVPAIATFVRLTAGRGPGWLATGMSAAILFIATAAYFSGPGVLDLPFMRRTGVNLEATRGDEPKVWLVAHIDSKWQPVSMIVRVFGVILTAIGIIGTLFTPWALIVVWLGGVPLMLSVVGAKNDGTLDNASGVATVLEAASLLPPNSKVGILITDAEELALAGAKAWATTRKPVVALNVDSVDDDGPLVVMYSRSVPSGLVPRFEQAASRHREPLRAFRLIPGILTDHVALAEAGWMTVTLSRGTIRTLQRIHTMRDSLKHMDGRGIPGAARVLATVATELA